MSKVPTNDIGHSSRDQKYRHSLQPKSTTTNEILSPFRHTKSHNYEGSKTKKKTKARAPAPILETAIIEEEGAAAVMTIIAPPNVDATNENIKVTISHIDERKSSKRSKGSRKSSQAYDNNGFEPDPSKSGTPKDEQLSRSNSGANSVRSAKSTRSVPSGVSSRDPSIQSLTVVREQYCCCSRWTPCERTLFAAVSVLIFIIIILVIVIILVATGSNSTKSFITRLTD